MARILHVEDDPYWIDIVREALVDHTVETARSLSEASRLLLLAGEPYDVALVDLELRARGDAEARPGAYGDEYRTSPTGFERAGGEVLDLLRANYPDVRRLILTGRPEIAAEATVVARRFGVEQVQRKQSFEAGQLHRVIQDVLALATPPVHPPTPAEAPAVFICYGHFADRAYAQRLAQYLREEGIRVWCGDEQASDAAADAEANARIDSCAVFIVVMTPDAERSRGFFQQIYRAQDLGKAILPMLLSGSVFESLSGYGAEDVTGSVVPGAHVLARVHTLLEPHYRQNGGRFE